LEAVDAVLSEADGGRLTATEAIECLLGAQITLRNNRRLQTAMRASRLPAVKTLADFDFSFQPSIKREQRAGDLPELRRAAQGGDGGALGRRGAA
jgi:DNA replication protein DnaC